MLVQYLYEKTLKIKKNCDLITLDIKQNIYICIKKVKQLRLREKLNNLTCARNKSHSWRTQ